MYLLTFAPSEDSNQLVHPYILIGLCCPNEETLHQWLSNIRLGKNQIRLRANAQADLNIRLAHMSEASRKHAYIIFTPLNTTFIHGDLQGYTLFFLFLLKNIECA